MAGVVTTFTNAVRSKHAANPKTVLAFYGTVIGLLLAGVVSAASVLAATDTQEWLIPWLFAFAGSVVVLLLIGVFIITLTDPSRLMLTQVTGSEYAVIQQGSIVGDSASGEHVIPALTTEVAPLLGGQVPPLPLPAGPEDENKGQP